MRQAHCAQDSVCPGAVIFPFRTFVGRGYRDAAGEDPKRKTPGQELNLGRVQGAPGAVVEPAVTLVDSGYKKTLSRVHLQSR